MYERKSVKIDRERIIGYLSRKTGNCLSRKTGNLSKLTGKDNLLSVKKRQENYVCQERQEICQNWQGKVIGDLSRKTGNCLSRKTGK